MIDFARTRKPSRSTPVVPFCQDPDVAIEFVGLPDPKVGEPADLADELTRARRIATEGGRGLGGVAVDLLSPDDEVRLFRAMNRLKWAAELQRRAVGRAGRASEREKARRTMGALLTAALRIRNRIVEANVRLVFSAANRFAAARLDRGELESEGNYTLLRAVEKFDFSRGFRFSTYATWAIRYRFQRMARRTGDPLRDRRAGADATDALAAPKLPDPAETANRRRWVGALDRILEQLDPREREVVTARFGLGNESTCSLNDVARRLGVCKERVRQLQLRALAKLRGLAHANRIDPPLGD